MNFLYDIALPQPTEHFQLLLFMLNLVYVVFFPYLGFLLGSATVSWHFRARGGDARDDRRTLFARNALELALNTKALVLFLGLLPGLSMVFLYAQILQGTGAIAPGLMLFGCLLLWVGGALLYAYKFTTSYGELLEKAAGSGQAEMLARNEKNRAAQLKFGRYGLLSLATGSALTIGALAVAQNPEAWEATDSVFALLILPAFWVKLGHFLTVALGTTGVGMLFFHFNWEEGKKQKGESYAEILQRVGMGLSFFSILAQPLFLVLGIIVLPAASLSGSAFALGGISLLLLLLVALFLYGFARDGNRNLLSYAFYSLGVALVLTFTIDQMAIRNATGAQAVQTARIAEKGIEAMKAKLGIAAPSMSGAEIYGGKCSACHLFDEKKVGPPYNTVIPKYFGKKGELISFVLNPRKVDPAFPPMPNQGLRPAEADSIASYLLQKAGGAVAPAPATAEPEKRNQPR